MKNPNNKALQKDLESRFESLFALSAKILGKDFELREVLEFLLKHSSLKQSYKELFFSDIDGNLIFEKERFMDFLNLRNVSESFTKFSNKIGLGLDKKFLKNSENVVLNFPFKDCVLKATQSNDKKKTKELFFNEILARSEIDVLFSPKALSHFELLTTGGGGNLNADSSKAKKAQSQHKALKDALLKESNFLIKGNNLIALHSLRKRKDIFGKVKLIYIDPPYNTGNDSFNYNDNFKHSTWLVFMKNRLEIAREFLRDDGVIFIQCDDNEQAYLKVLCDEIFGRENFVACVVWANKEGGGKSDSKHFRQKHEYILCYAKKKDNLEVYGQSVEDIQRYTLSDKHEATRGKYQLIKLDSGSLGWVKSLDYPIELEGKIFYAGGSYEKWLYRQNGGASIKDWGWRWSKEKLEWGLKNDFIEIKQNNKGEWNIYTKQYLNCDNEGNITPRILKPSALIEKHSNTQSNRHMKLLDVGFTYSKPEGLVMEILNYTTQEGDLVMDFFAGSGTTLAVAHKMNRRYVGIEQMHYIESITKERLKKVLAGEQGGISKAVGYQGGGSFIYLELAPLNAKIKEQITKAESQKELELLLDKIKKEAFLDYRVKLKEDLKDPSYQNASLEEQKLILKACLDKNMDYILYENMSDSAYKIDEKTQELNKIFYGENDE